MVLPLGFKKWIKLIAFYSFFINVLFFPQKQFQLICLQCLSASLNYKIQALFNLILFLIAQWSFTSNSFSDFMEIFVQ